MIFAECCFTLLWMMSFYRFPMRITQFHSLLYIGEVPNIFQATDVTLVARRQRLRLSSAVARQQAAEAAL
jgi:hypothetical protein